MREDDPLALRCACCEQPHCTPWLTLKLTVYKLCTEPDTTAVNAEVAEYERENHAQIVASAAEKQHREHKLRQTWQAQSSALQHRAAMAQQEDAMKLKHMREAARAEASAGLHALPSQAVLEKGPVIQRTPDLLHAVPYPVPHSKAALAAAVAKSTRAGEKQADLVLQGKLSGVTSIDFNTRALQSVFTELYAEPQRGRKV